MGNAGSGKTTMATQLAMRLDIPHVELDAIHHLPGWAPIDRDEFRRTVAARCDDDAWIVDGNYSAVRDVVLARADTVVLLDLPKALVMTRVIRRSVHRAVTGEELWNGNRERWSQLVSPRKEDNIVLWAWTQHGKYRRRYLELITDPSLAHLDVVRLRSRTEIDEWLGGLR